MWVSLNLKQQAFAREYLKDQNATQAAIRAGYSKRSAGSQGHDLLNHPEIQALIGKAAEKVADRLELSAARVLGEIGHFAHADLRDAFKDDGTLKHVHEMPEHLRRAIKSFEVEELFEGSGQDKFKAGRTVKVQLWDKPKGLELEGRHLKLFTDKLEVTGKVTLEQLIDEAAARGKGTPG